MPTQKIIFKVITGIQVKPFAVKIEKIDFPTGQGDETTEITEIFFEGAHDPSGQIGIGKAHEMEFELSEIKDKRVLKMQSMSAVKENFSMASGPEDTTPPNELILEPDKKLRVVHNKFGDTIKIQSKEEEQTPPPTPNPETPQPKPPTPKNPDQNPDQDNPDQGPSTPTPKQPDESPDQKDTPEPKKDTPPQSSEPTPEEKSATTKLNQAQESDNKDEIVNILNETKDTVTNSSNSDLKKAWKATEDKLGQVDKEELRRIIKEEVTNELKKLGIKTDDLSPENKQKLDELNNNNNNNNNNNINSEEVKRIRTEVLNAAGMTALDHLIAEVEQAIKSGNAKQIKTKVEKLKQFTEDTSDEYAQNAYRQKKDAVQALFSKAENKSSSNKEEGFFRLNNPLMWISGVAIIGLVVGISLIVVRSRRKHANH